MREIKFRVWDEIKGEMIYDPNSWACIHLSGMFNNPASNWIWMQFTGLKDKNGKDIYEGDIIQSIPLKGTCGIVSSVNGQSTFVRKVVWLDNEGSFGWELMDGMRCQSGYCLYAKDVLEIIGNVHEPKLLEKNNVR